MPRAERTGSSWYPVTILETDTLLPVKPQQLRTEASSHSDHSSHMLAFEDTCDHIGIPNYMSKLLLLGNSDLVPQRRASF